MKSTVEKQVADYWNNIAPEFDKIYSGDKGPLGRFLDKWLRADIYQRYDWVMERAHALHGTSVCDVGCGTGRFLVGLAGLGYERLVGIDVAPNMITMAGEHTARAGVSERCRLINTDIEDWKSDEDPFDVTIAIGFWDYIEDPASRLEKIRSITKPAGIFLSAWPRAGTARAAIRKVRLDREGCPSYYYTREGVEDQLRRRGFEPSDYRIAGQLHLIEARAV